jgi:hypothetical protein
MAHTGGERHIACGRDRRVRADVGNTPGDQDRMRRRMAEFLVHERVPVTCISEIVVRHETMKRQVNQILAAHGAEIPDRCGYARDGTSRMSDP